MKIRHGFVSNSSSSSFCIYGACIKKDRVNEEEVEKQGLSVYYGDPNNGGDYVGVGRAWRSIGDEETGKQFKDSITLKIKELFVGTENFSTIQEAWYNG